MTRFTRDVALNRDEKCEIERRKPNMIVYRAPEIESDEAEDRKAGDMAFFQICKQGLGVTLGNDDIVQMYRLGRREENKVRPLLVKCKDEAIKMKIFSRVKDLKYAEARFRGISISHDLTPRQRECVKEVRLKAIEELQEEQQSASGSRGQMSVNRKVIVVGQRTANPKAIKIVRD